MKKSLANRLLVKKKLHQLTMHEGTSLRAHIDEFNKIIISLEQLDIKTGMKTIP